MRLRKSYIVEDQVLGASGTVIKNLNYSDPIAAIFVAIIGKKHDHTNLNPQISRGISKIEVVDGSHEMFSLNMEMAQALELAVTTKKPIDVMTCNSFATNVSHVMILFGRELSDTEWALDPTKFDNPQLKITYAYTEGASNWKDNEQKITIYVLLQENVGARPPKFLMTKEFYSWSKATSGDEPIPMNREFPHRLLLWNIKDCTSPVWNELNKIKITCDQGKWIPIEQPAEDLGWENAKRTGMLIQQSEIIGAAVDADINAYYPFAWNWGAAIESWNLGGNCKVKRPYSGYITVRGAGAAHASAVPADEALSAGQRVLVTGRGYEYNHCEHLQFGDLKDAGEFLDVKDFKSAELIFTQGGGDALTTKVASQQLRPNSK